MTVKVAVIYYSATGTVRALAEAVAAGAAEAGAEVRLRRVAESMPAESMPAESAAGSPAGSVPAERLAGSALAERPGERPAEATSAGVSGPTHITAALDDLAWADAFAFGTPTRFGTPAAQLKHFIDRSVGLWRDGELADKPVTAFTSAHNRHGGSEATILSLGNVFYHWGALIVPPGYTDPAVYAAGGNPYGTSTSGGGADDAALDAARHQGRRLARIATRLLAGTP